MSPEVVVQSQLDAYNARDVDAHCRHFVDNVVVATYNGEQMRRGLSEYRAFHVDLFSTFPNNKAELLNRIAVGGKVIDYERVDRGDGETSFEVAAIYTFEGDKIARVDFIR